MSNDRSKNMSDINLNTEQYDNIKDIVTSLCNNIESILENDTSFLCDDHPELYTCLAELADLYESSSFRDSMEVWNDVIEENG